MKYKHSIDKYYVQENLEQLLSQIGKFYVGSKSNKIYIKKFFNSFPFFFFNIDNQNTLYKIIKNYEIDSYIDKNNHMKNFCYMIYKDFSIKNNIKYKNKYDFYNDLEYNLHNETQKIKRFKQRNLHTYIFFIMIILFLGLYFYLRDKTN